MKLFYRVFGSGKPMVIMHGVFGTSDNWVSVSKILAEHFEVYLLDLRNHGQSPHSNDFSYQDMAKDLEQFIIEHQLEKPIVIGHSMGGKVAMKYASIFNNLSKLVVVDIAPRFYNRHHDHILYAMNSMPLDEIKTRNEADEFMSNYIREIGVRQFLLKNLYRTENGDFAWRVNLDVITKNIDIVGEPLITDERISVPTLFIKGSLSDYITKEDEFHIHQMFSNAKIANIDGAGHWVQADRPEAFSKAVIEFAKN